MLIGKCSNDYQGFAAKKTVLKELYTMNKDKKNDELIEPSGRDEIDSSIANRKPFDFDTSEWFWTTKMTTYCCCFASTKCYRERKKRIKVFEEANKRLKGEIDMLRFIKTTRMLNLLLSVENITKAQLKHTKWFKAYNIDTEDLEMAFPDDDDVAIENFDPHTNYVDKKILEEITGKSVSDNEIGN